jgi:cytochrome c553
VAALAALASVTSGCVRTPELPSGRAWNTPSDELSEGLRLTGDAERGKVAYQVCAHCHLESGAGIADGTMPQIAGQHRSVVIKQMVDIRTGFRHNPVMYPYTLPLDDPQRLADLASYLQSLPIPTRNGRGPGVDLERGRRLYAANCVSCHGEQGQGDAAKFYPVLAGQHYAYMLRQITDIRDGRRRPVDPAMIESLQQYDDGDLSAVVDYMSRLRWPERQPAG